MKKTKIYGTLGLMLFSANTDAMEIVENPAAAKKINIISCTDYLNYDYPPAPAQTSCSANLNYDYPPAPAQTSCSANLNYDYPPAPALYGLENIRFVHRAHQFSEEEIKAQKKYMHKILDKKYKEIIEEADTLLRNQKKSFFSRVTKSISNFFYGLIGKKAPMPTPICNRIEHLLNDLNDKMLENYIVAHKKFTENEINREFPKMKELAQKFRHKFTFQAD